MPNSEFKESVYTLMAKVPAGKVTTYGDLASLAGHAYASRVVGGMAHYGPTDLPWHRLVNRFGGLASGFHGGREQQRLVLEAEGVLCDDTFKVIDFEARRWRP